MYTILLFLSTSQPFKLFQIIDPYNHSQERLKTKGYFCNRQRDHKDIYENFKGPMSIFSRARRARTPTEPPNRLPQQAKATPGNVSCIYTDARYVVEMSENDVPSSLAGTPEWRDKVKKICLRDINMLTPRGLNAFISAIKDLRNKPLFYPEWVYWIQTMKKSETDDLIKLIYEEIDKRYALLETGDFDVLDTKFLQSLLNDNESMENRVLTSKPLSPVTRPTSFNVLVDNA